MRVGRQCGTAAAWLAADVFAPLIASAVMQHSSI